jgi:hypothetical protein
MLSEKFKKQYKYNASCSGFFGPFDWEEIEKRLELRKKVETEGEWKVICPRKYDDEK